MGKTPFHVFSDKIQTSACFIFAILFILIMTMILPHKKQGISIIFGKIFAVCLISYVVFSIIKNTTNFIKQVPNIFSNAELSNYRNNALLSYILSLSLLFLGLYVIYSFFF